MLILKTKNEKKIYSVLVLLACIILWLSHNTWILEKGYIYYEWYHSPWWAMQYMPHLIVWYATPFIQFSILFICSLALIIVLNQSSTVRLRNLKKRLLAIFILSVPIIMFDVFGLIFSEFGPGCSSFFCFPMWFVVIGFIFFEFIKLLVISSVFWLIISPLFPKSK